MQKSEKAYKEYTLNKADGRLQQKNNLLQVLTLRTSVWTSIRYY